MPNSISEFFTRIPGQKSDIRSLDNYLNKQGDFAEIKNVDVMLRSIMNLLMTIKGTYIFDPEFGCNIVKYIFEPADEITRESILQDVAANLARYEDRGDNTYNIKFLSGNLKGFVLNISVSYQDEKKEISIRIDESLLKSMEI